MECRVKEATYRNYLLIVLMVLVALSNTDGLTFGLVLQDIKRDLGLSDTQLGVLTGIAFASFYAVMGIPIARWADKGDRIALISVTQLVWGLMLAACGLASNFWQLLLIRVGVAVGEAGCIPPAHSLIAEAFPRADRARAVGIFMVAAPLSMAIGYLGAGWINELYGWRRTFMSLGLLGFASAIVAWTTLRESRRTERVKNESPSDKSEATVWQVCLALWANKTFRRLLVGYSVVYFFGYGLAQWQPAYFIRSYSVNTGALGTALATAGGSGLLIGTLAGGAWASRFAANNERLQLRAIAVAYVLFGAISSLIYLSHHYWVALGFAGLSAVGGAATNGPLFSTIQTLIPAHMRAMSIAVVYLFANLIGMGLGPLVAGALSDALRPLAGDESLRYALLILCPGYLWGAWHLWRASESVNEDLQMLNAAPPIAVLEQ
jgi:MFS transporter, Spinster family, sphingosine-1-phosphate transporter